MRNDLDVFHPKSPEEVLADVGWIRSLLCNWELRDSIVDITADLHPHVRERIVGFYFDAAAAVEILANALVAAGLDEMPPDQPRL
jgi:hypothetical protein